MTQVWVDDRVVPVTVIRVPSCRVVQIKTPETDGYSAVQVTFGQQKPQRLTGGERGHFDKAGVDPGKRLVELRVDVTAVSKGKGFAGAMKRHNFAGQRASHGAHRVHRAPGAIGACATPARVFKGTRMAGRMGGQKVTTQNLEVVQADAERDLILVKGSVPGANGGLVIIRDAVKAGV